jgi:hypothetical protein
MKITRVYTDGEGESHFDDLVIGLRDAGPIGFLSEPFPAKEVLFRRNEAGYDYDWHPAPRRQFIVLLDGAIELQVSDGERRIFHGGEILLLEDIHGRGHRTRNLEARERHSVFVVLE